jgi:hypothetical protein
LVDGFSRRRSISSTSSSTTQEHFSGREYLG